MGVPWLSLHTVATIYQAIGVLFTAAGIAAIGDRLRYAKDAAAAVYARTRSGVVGWSARRRVQFAVLWARITRKSRSVTIQAASAHLRFGAGMPSLTAQVHRHRVDRDTISDRDWLAHLDDRLESVFELMDAAEKRRSQDRDEFASRLGVQRDELRTEIIRETRNGWQLVAWGLFYAFVGVVLGL